MKKINFIVILFTFVVSIGGFIYVDILAELIIKTEGWGKFQGVTSGDIVITFFATFIYGMLPSWGLAYAYTKIQMNGWWIIFIFMAYSILWVGISFLNVKEYITYFGCTWLEIEIFGFAVSQEHFLLIYFLSLVPLIVLGIFNVRKIDEVR